MSSDPILAAFDARLRRRAEAPMVVGRRESSVADVDRAARSAGAKLADRAFPAGSLIGVAAADGVGFLAAFLAVRRAACSALLLDWRAPPDVAGALGATALLCCRDAWPRGDDAFSLASVPGGSPDGAAVRLAPEIAAIKLTSGSTGAPRGIVTPSRALVADDRALAACMELRDDERILVSVPMSHSYGLSSVVMPALMRDAVLVLPEAGDPLDPVVVARARKATFMPTVPAYLCALVRMSKPPAVPSSLRLVVSAGAPLDPATAVRFRQVYGLGVHVFYGASESGGISFDRDGTAGEKGTLGRLVDGVRVKLTPVPAVAAPDAAADCGLVTVTSPAVADGYLGEADPSLAGGRFQSRDLARFEGGELRLEGRLDEIINVKGKKVHPREVDRVLGRLDGVEEVVTVGVKRPGQAGEIVRSFVACDAGALSYVEIQAWCRSHLAEYKVPRSIIVVERIPKTSRGKVDRAALLALAEGRGG